MATKPTTGLETHPVNTTGLNGIVNANWERLEAIFAPLATATVTGRIAWNTALKCFSLRPGVDAIVYSATPGLNFAGAVLQTIALTGDAVFSSLNLAAGAVLAVAVTASGGDRAVSFPAWKWIGRTSAPTSLPSGKTALLRLTSVGTTNAEVLAEWVEESVGSGGSADTASAILAAAPYAYYKCDESSGTAINDSSGNGRHATIGGTYTLAQGGLNAGETSIAMTAARILANTTWNHTDFTCMGWFYPTYSPPAGSAPTLFAQRSASTVRLSTHMAANRQGLESWNGSTAGSSPGLGNFLMLTGWYHIAIVRSSTPAQLYYYVNGRHIGDVARTLGASTTDPFAVGSTSAAYAEPFIGRVAHVAVFDRAMVERDIRKICGGSF